MPIAAAIHVSAGYQAAIAVIAAANCQQQRVPGWIFQPG
jgi:hypothetical protein